MRKDSFIAATRFGLGARPEEVSAIESSPQSWLVAQLEHPQPLPDAMANLPSSQANIMTLMQKTGLDKNTDKDKLHDLKKDLRQGYIYEMGLRAGFAATTNTPFVERLVDFWSNHFAVSVLKGAVMGLAGPFEREAIRPHVTGNFTDMLLAVAHHPAMLVYLDNAQSIGPDSEAGERRGKGLNENLAREIMELHTLGVNGGYTQQDVTTFAKVLTGWSIARKEDTGGIQLFRRRRANETHGTPGTFQFYPMRHEPGSQTILGHTYADNGEAQGIAVLRDLAANPATARHIATKLARHFIADSPPQSAVDALADVFQRTNGDLKSVYQALINLPDPWAMASFKIKSSYDLVISAARVCGGQVPAEWCLQSMRFLGDFPFTATSPAGFPDIAQDIAGPEAVLRRIEWARSAPVHLAPIESIASIADRAVGPLLQSATAQQVNAARNPQEGLALVLASPEFQKR